jgi:hypothetical protein
LPPFLKAKYDELLEQGLFTEAYDIWNKTAETHLGLQLKDAKLPNKCKGKGKVPTFKTQSLAAQGTRLIEAGAATQWSLRLGKLIRKCLELESRLKRNFYAPIEPGTESFALTKALQVDIVYSGRNIVTGWDAVLTDGLPPLQHVQEWLQKSPRT